MFLLYPSGSLSLVREVVRCRLREVEGCEDENVELEYPSGRVVVRCGEDMGLGG